MTKRVQFLLHHGGSRDVGDVLDQAADHVHHLSPLLDYERRLQLDATTTARAEEAYNVHLGPIAIAFVV